MRSIHLNTAALALAASLLACSPKSEHAAPAAPRPSILLVTLDTTRADAVGPEAKGVETPAFNALAERGLRFRQAYATVPQTLPSHTSMLTGLYPGGHGVHENARQVPPTAPLLAEKLHASGYTTAAFISSFVLARQFGLARGFDAYDDDFGAGRVERTARETTDRALAWLEQSHNAPRFVWVHYWDPHYPYTPPEPYRTRYATRPYLGEVAFVDAELGRLVSAFERQAGGASAIVVVGDHGEGLGEHGEAEHGNLLYQSTMHVPLLIVAPGVPHGTTDATVSTRRIFDTILDIAGLVAPNTLRVPRNGARETEVAAGESMQPFLEYGWQPQVMAVEGRQKAILAGRLEVYDVISDPDEKHDLAATASLSRSARATLHDYPVPSLPAGPGRAPSIDPEAQRKLASLGYISSDVKPVVRKDAPRPADMTALFEPLERAATLFGDGKFADAIPIFNKVLTADPYNLDAALHLAIAHSSLGHGQQAVDAFRKAEAIAPHSADVAMYLGLHYARAGDFDRAVPLLEHATADFPGRLPPLEALAGIREKQHRIGDALALRQQIASLRTATAPELAHLGELAMAAGQTGVAIDAFERERASSGGAFRHDLELGVLYLASGRYPEARDALDRVPPSSPGYAMALFKRAQVSVLLHEPDTPARIAAARQHADATTAPLIANERLFR